jgi:hypothetical protein
VHGLPMLVRAWPAAYLGKWSRLQPQAPDIRSGSSSTFGSSSRRCTVLPTRMGRDLLV